MTTGGQFHDRNPIPSKEDKITANIKNRILLKRLRWRALAFLGKLQEDNAEKYGFQSWNCPPVVNELTNFENDMQLMIKMYLF